MNSRERLLMALDRGQPDRLPVTTHHLMPYFLDKYMNGIGEAEFFEFFSLDPVTWVWDQKADEAAGCYWTAIEADAVGGGLRWIVSDEWRIETEAVSGSRNKATRYNIVTPEATLTMVLEESSQSTWVVEKLIKQKSQIELIDKYAPRTLCDVDAVNRTADDTATRGIVRGSVPGFEIYGQPGCWQDAAVLYGIERLLMQTFDDPTWVHELLDILKRRKIVNVESMKGARFDLIEHGGGDASSTVISPKIFEEFVAPYDREVIAAARGVGQRVVYHTCGGMMPILEQIADMGPDAMETFTPPSLGGDTDLREAKRRIGDCVCMIGGFDQARFFQGCAPQETRLAVRRCFEDAGLGGGFILAPSDHFFDADVELIKAFAEEATTCTYS
ncbi:MAG: hypothetical protein JSW51_00370 [Gemmatimonadota bacterium]|nr:MAG: hypothetical protein JSW51_00370 [Gemmatimonadota bacterium]